MKRRERLIIVKGDQTIRIEGEEAILEYLNKLPKLDPVTLAPPCPRCEIQRRGEDGHEEG